MKNNDVGKSLFPIGSSGDYQVYPDLDDVVIFPEEPKTPLGNIGDWFINQVGKIYNPAKGKSNNEILQDLEQSERSAEAAKKAMMVFGGATAAVAAPAAIADMTAFAVANPQLTAKLAANFLGGLIGADVLKTKVDDAMVGYTGKNWSQYMSSKVGGPEWAWELLNPSIIAGYNMGSKVANSAPSMGTKLSTMVNDSKQAVNEFRLAREMNKTAEAWKPQSPIYHESYIKPWRNGQGKNQATSYFFADKPKQRFEVVRDIDATTRQPNGEYGIHFKTDRGALTSEEKDALTQHVVDQLPEGAKLATYGDVSKGGFNRLSLFPNYGMSPTGEFRKLGFKDPTIAQATADKYGLTLNEDGTINWPILQKGQPDISSKIYIENTEFYDPTLNLYDSKNIYRPDELVKRNMLKDWINIDDAASDLEKDIYLRQAGPKYARLYNKEFNRGEMHGKHINSYNQDLQDSKIKGLTVNLGNGKSNVRTDKLSPSSKNVLWHEFSGHVKNNAYPDVLKLRTTGNSKADMMTDATESVLTDAYKGIDSIDEALAVNRSLRRAIVEKFIHDKGYYPNFNEFEIYINELDPKIIYNTMIGAKDVYNNNVIKQMGNNILDGINKIKKALIIVPSFVGIVSDD